MTDYIPNPPPADTEYQQLRMPPHSLEAEQSVLGGLLLDNSAWDRIGDVVINEDFYRHDHRLIFQAIAKLIERSHPADVVTVSEQAGKKRPAGRGGRAGVFGHAGAKHPVGGQYQALCRDCARAFDHASAGTDWH